jgi:transposase InsO family protein
MGYLETRAVDKRMRFVMAVEAGDETMALLCRRFGLSRKAGYKWLGRYHDEGLDGLGDRSRAPHAHPQAVSAALAERCLAVRYAHPTWGPVKVRAWLERRAPGVGWPAASTIGTLFDREGLTVKRKLRRRATPSGAPFAACAGANEVWCIDFKGWFLTGDGAACEPLTLSDAFSRYLLRCQALGRHGAEHVWPVLDAAFREYGLPRRLRSDNGPPFASTGAGGLSQLAVKVIKAGVVPERIAPGKPQQNGRLERLHLTLLQDTASPPAPSLRQQKARFRAFQRVYNAERPHAALGNATPAEHYAASPRRWDGILREPEYPAEHEVRRVRPNGAIRRRGVEIYITQALAGEPIGLVEQADGGWLVRYGPVELGLIDHRGDRLRRAKPKAGGLVDNPAGLPTTPPAQQPQQPT